MRQIVLPGFELGFDLNFQTMPLKQISHSLLKITLLALSITVLESATYQPIIPPENARAILYSFGNNSQLAVIGKTNINTFSCFSKERFSQNKLFYQVDKATSSVQFLDTRLLLQISEMDCGGAMINKDFQKTLKAKQYPFIELNLMEAINLDCNTLEECGNWIFFKTKTNITLNGQTREEEIPVHVLKKNEKSYQITGTKTIELKDFEIEPPTALMGMIKVQNSIKIDFDLEIILS